MKGVLVIATLSLAAGCANAPLAAQDSASPVLATRHTSVFNRIDYRIPKGWVVVDGESDWLAPNDDKQFWAPGFRIEADAYYVVSTVFPHLTMDDMRQKRVRSVDDIAAATLHALQVSAAATVVQPLKRYRINGNDAISFETAIGRTHVHYQVFIHLADGKVATVAGNGPRTQLSSIRALVAAIAATVEPGRKK